MTLAAMVSTTRVAAMSIAPDMADLAARIPAPYRVKVGVPEDIDRVVEFQNRYARPAGITPIELVRKFELHNPQPKRLVLVVLGAAGQVVAVGQTSDGGSFRRPDGAFNIGVRVAPDDRGKGVGGGLLDRLEAHAREQGAPRLTAAVREDEPDGVTFAARRGYVETNRRYDAYLDVQSFDAGRFDDVAAIERRAGVRIVTYGELERERSSDRDALQREVYELGALTGSDIPRPEPMHMPPYEAIRDVFFGPDVLDRASTVVALRDGRMVAATLTAMRSPGVAYTNMTGTLRAERGKGLATALKLRAIAELKKGGARLFGTTNDEQNAAMRGINARLGYQPDPALIELEKRLPPA